MSTATKQHRGQPTFEQELFGLIKKIEQDIDMIELNLDNVTEPLLIDGYTFELKALNSRHAYYMSLLKELCLSDAV
jgi:hypothetical protein